MPHPFLEKITEIYDLYCATEINDYPDDPSKLSKKYSKTQLTKLSKEFTKINNMIEDDMPSLAKILSSDADDFTKKDLMEKFLIFIQTEKNSVEFFELRDILNSDIEGLYRKKRKLTDILIENRLTDTKKIKIQVKKIESDGLRNKIESLETSKNNKDIIMKKLEKLEDMSRAEGEYHKLKDYLSKISRVPFGKYAKTDITPQNVKKAKELLDKHVMFNYEAKDEVINYLVNDSNHCISLFGPPGTSKSTIVQKGLSEALGRPMRVISLGGKKDSSYLTGHSYTYEGAICGRIVDILVETQVMNPIIYFDELDKISGKSINGVLTHLIDPSQNFDFHDNYFSGISFDLSKVLFVFSYNDVSELDLVVSDRIKHIHVKVLDCKQKVEVLKNITLPGFMVKYFKDSEIDLTFTDECLTFLSRKYNGEGMRGVIKDLEHIVSRLKTLYFLRDTGDKKDLINSDYGKLDIDFKSKVVITTDTVKRFFQTTQPSESFNHMYL